MIHLSMVTYQRRDILRKTLDAIIATTPEPYRLLVSDNACTDGTAELLDDYKSRMPLDVWHLSDNLGTAGGRNAHWQECLGVDSVRIDDKVLPLASGWLTALKTASDQHHAIVGPPYDPSIGFLHNLAPALEYIDWPQDHGRGGPLLFIPGEVTAALGAVDELADDIKYGWDDSSFIHRAMLLGWHFGFTLRVPVQMMASANPAARERAMQYHPLYLKRLHEYTEAERDVFLPLEETYGWKAGQAARR